MSEIQKFSNSSIPQKIQREQSKPKPKTDMQEDFNSELRKNLEHLKSLENRIDDLDTNSEQSTASSLDHNVKNVGNILKDIEGIWENLKTTKGTKKQS